jgi:hypothetical protein
MGRFPIRNAGLRTVCSFLKSAAMGQSTADALATSNSQQLDRTTIFGTLAVPLGCGMLQALARDCSIALAVSSTKNATGVHINFVCCLLRL